MNGKLKRFVKQFVLNFKYNPIDAKSKSRTKYNRKKPINIFIIYKNKKKMLKMSKLHNLLLHSLLKNNLA